MTKTVLVVGQGAREHALAEALAGSPSRPRVVAAPGNPGIAGVAEVRPVAVDDVEGLARLAGHEGASLVVVGPELPLVLGLGDALRARGIPVLGPSRAAAALEGSKAFAKGVMAEAGIPTARWGAFTELRPALEFARALPGAVVKADGLAAGKGVVVARDEGEVEAALRAALGGAFGAAGRTVVVEERLHGEEVSVLALTDGRALAVLPPARDHKRLRDGDLGPNTGGMGALSPPPDLGPGVVADVEARCLRPVLEALARRGRPFSGVLFAGLVLTAGGPRVLEYNVRFGDPEAQALLARLDGDLFEVLDATARGGLDPEAVSVRGGAAVTVVLAAEGYPGRPRTGDPIRGLDRAAAVAGVQVHHGGTAWRDGALVTAGGRVLSLTGRGEDLASAARAAYRAVDAIAWPGMQVRRDLGAGLAVAPSREA